jgi:hypothetical protein
MEKIIIACLVWGCYVFLVIHTFIYVCSSSVV